MIALALKHDPSDQKKNASSISEVPQQVNLKTADTMSSPPPLTRIDCDGTIPPHYFPGRMPRDENMYLMVQQGPPATSLDSILHNINLPVLTSLFGRLSATVDTLQVPWYCMANNIKNGVVTDAAYITACVTSRLADLRLFSRDFSAIILETIQDLENAGTVIPSLNSTLAQHASDSSTSESDMDASLLTTEDTHLNFQPEIDDHVALVDDSWCQHDHLSVPAGVTQSHVYPSEAGDATYT